MFAETAIVDYRLSFAGQGKQTSVFRFPQTEKFAISIFRLQETNRSCRFPPVPLSVCGILETWSHGPGDKA
jgi:hypothetical protein